MIEGTYARKLDTTGRIMIPVRLREQMGMLPGEEYEFVVLEQNGHRYLAIDCGAIEDSTALEEALKIVRRSGLRVF